MLVKVCLGRLAHIKRFDSPSNQSCHDPDEVITCSFERPWNKNVSPLDDNHRSLDEIELGFLPMILPFDIGVFGPKKMR